MIKDVLKRKQSLWIFVFQQESPLSNEFQVLFIIYYYIFIMCEVQCQRSKVCPASLYRLLHRGSIGVGTFQVYLQIKETQTLGGLYCSQAHIIIKSGFGV